MKNSLFVLAALLLTGTAMAQNPPPKDPNWVPPGQRGGNNVQPVAPNVAPVYGGVDYRNTNTNLNTNTSRSTSTAVSGAAAGAISGAVSGGNTQGVDVDVSISNPDRMRYSGSYKLENVPDVNAPAVYPTAPCMGSTSVGGAGVGFGVSIGSTWKDDDCSIRETARSFSGMGMPDDAVAILCSSPYAAAAPACKALKSTPAVAGAPAGCYPDALVAKRKGMPAC